MAKLICAAALSVRVESGHYVEGSILHKSNPGVFFSKLNNFPPEVGLAQLQTVFRAMSKGLYLYQDLPDIENLSSFHKPIDIRVLNDIINALCKEARLSLTAPHDEYESLLLIHGMVDMGLQRQYIQQLPTDPYIINQFQDHEPQPLDQRTISDVDTRSIQSAQHRFKFGNLTQNSPVIPLLAMARPLHGEFLD